MSDSILEAENGLIGCILTDNAVLAEIDLSPMEFVNRQCSRIYAAAQAMAKRNEVIDVFTLADELARHSDQDWLPVLASMAANVISPKHAKDYAEAISRKNRERTAIDIANSLICDIHDRGLDAIDRAVVELMGLSVTKRKTVYTMREAAKQALDLIDQVASSGGLVGVSTGYKDLNDMLGGYHDTDLIITGARPAMGKTAYMINQVLRHGVPVGVFTTEQPSVQIALRSIAIEGRIDSSRLRAANLEDYDYHNMTRAISLLKDAQIYFDEQSQPSIADIQRQARRWRHEHGIGIIHVDYVQRIKATDQRAPKHERVEEVVVGLKTLAKELQLPVVALAQVNRDVEKRNDKRPSMGDLKDSGAIEQEADVICMLYRDEVYDENTMDKGIAELNVEKNRHGPIGKIKLAWVGNHMRFEDLATGWGR